MRLNDHETALLFGAPRCGKQETDRSVRLALTKDDAWGHGSRGWIVYAELGGMKVVVAPKEAEALARRVLSRDPNDDLAASDSLILDRRAEILLEVAEQALP